ncbi:MAG: DHHA1 domain-containing protein [Candidatus Eremiobacterota bacterium]
MLICSCHDAHRPQAAGRRHRCQTSAEGEVKDEVQIGQPVAVSSTGLSRTGEASACSALLGGFCSLTGACLPAIFELAEKHPPDEVTHVLYHGGCLDGMTAAWGAWKRLGNRAKYIPVAYQSGLPTLPRDARVAILDFSYPPEQMKQLAASVKDVVVLDHHETALENLKGLDYALVEQERAGAGLSWHFFHPDEPLPALVAHAEDRDLWRFDIPKSAEVNKAMASYDMTMENWDRFDVEVLKKEGTQIMAYLDRQNLELTEIVQQADIAGYTVPVVNSHVNVDELASVILDRYPDAPFMASYYDGRDGRRKWSLRSRSNFEVNTIARQFGGGGHDQAAGFKEATPREVRVVPDGGAPPEAHRLDPLPFRSKAVKRFVGEQVDRAMAAERTGEIDGHRVPIANASLNVDQTGKALLAKHPEAEFVGVYYDAASGDRCWKLFTSRNFDLNAVTEKFGGSGDEFVQRGTGPLVVRP